MMDKLNVSALKEYSLAYAKRLSDYFFIDNELVTGKQMLRFCDVQQVNLLMVGGLFEAWQREINRFRSPYFDYEATEVKETLKAFLDTASRHIAVKKTDFEPLLSKAVYDTLLLIFSPRQYFKEWLSEAFQEEIAPARLQEYLKYIQINKFILKGLIERMGSEARASLPVAEASRWLDEIIHSRAEQLEEPRKFEEVFSEKLLLDAQSFTSEPAPVVPPVSILVVEAIPANRESATEEPPFAPPRNGPIELSLNERFSKEQQTLNDSLRQATKGTTLDRQLKTRIENIKSAIPLNQKFVFINELFKGDAAAYHQALNELEQCSTYQSANQLLRESYAKAYGWNMDGEEAEAFFEIIERKFY
ncbi:MAG: hypothetical protein H7Z75_04370 [Ferruginibacter sp.]|nr:hypothetical protein [Cytophagales bacterium]